MRVPAAGEVTEDELGVEYVHLAAETDEIDVLHHAPSGREVGPRTMPAMSCRTSSMARRALATLATYLPAAMALASSIR